MKIIVTAIFIVSIFSNCQSGRREPAQAFYQQLNRVIDRAELPLDQLSDSVISIHTALRADNEYMADTSSIGVLLERCIQANQLALDSLGMMKDPSNDIGLKQTAIIYVTDWKDLLRQEFTEWYQLLGRPMDNKADYLSAMFTSALKESSLLSTNLTQKSRSFKKEFEF